MAPIKIAIIGGGLSGTLLSINLIKRINDRTLDIRLFEKSPQKLFRGVAYSAALPYQLLNVPVKGMSLFEDDPMHFLAWLAEKGHCYTADDFVSRELFGNYLEENLTKVLADNKAHHYNVVKTEVTQLSKNESGVAVLSEEDSFRADMVFLCTGNFPPQDLPNLEPQARDSGRYINAPWSGGYLSQIKSDETIFIAGTGLTMVDQVMSLCKIPFSGKIIAASRRGYLPLSHGASPAYELKYTPDLDQAGIYDLYYWVKKEIRNAENNGQNFRSVIDAIRPHLQKMWFRMSMEDKKIFLKYIRPMWEIHRHRIPAHTYDALKEMVSNGRLQIIAGHIKSVSQNSEEEFVVTITEKKEKKTQAHSVNWILNCTGPQSNYKKIDSPLYARLFADGIISMDATGLGIKTEKYGHIIGEEGQVSRNIIAVGPTAKASLWESTALKEIRAQVDYLTGHAESLLSQAILSS